MSDPLEQPLIDRAGQASSLGEVLQRWHGALAADRGGRAALRRATELGEAFDALPFLRLCSLAMARFPSAESEVLVDRLVPIALGIAEIDTDEDAPPGAVFAKPKGPGKALTGARLRLLAGTDEIGLFLRLLRSAVAQTGRRQSVLGTAELLRRWQGSPSSRERARRRLLLEALAANGKAFDEAA